MVCFLSFPIPVTSLSCVVETGACGQSLVEQTWPDSWKISQTLEARAQGRMLGHTCNERETLGDK